jgi:hypothetical protein
MPNQFLENFAETSRARDFVDPLDQALTAQQRSIGLPRAFKRVIWWLFANRRPRYGRGLAIVIKFADVGVLGAIGIDGLAHGSALRATSWSGR